MSTMVLDSLFAFFAALLGAVGATWLCWSHFRRKAVSQTRIDAHHAARALAHLQELTARVAFDVDEHSGRIEEINDTLISADAVESNSIVDVVAKLIQANQEMHEKLATTESKLREQAREMQVHAAEARTDALTLLVNRRAFDDELVRRCAEFQRLGRTFSLIMADVDNFKKFNDAHGHLTGDDVLRGAAKLLRRKMREMDLVARYGGEEFAIILPGTDLADAERAALRACEGVERFHFIIEGKDLQVTMSFGVAEVQPQEDGVALIARADKALYAAKEGGRNCIFRHDGATVQRTASPKRPCPTRAEVQPPREPMPEGENKADRPPSDAVVRPSESQTDRSSADILDTLSNLPNRSTFCQQVRNRTAEWKRGGPIFSIALVEINPFDAGTGDRAHHLREDSLHAATKSLTAMVREMDVIGRYAADCFAILLPTAELANAIRMAERLRVEFSQSNPLVEGKQPRLTLSVGVVQIMEKDDSISVLKRAESALDAADRRGGDRAYYHDGERCAPITAMMETIDYLS